MGSLASLSLSQLLLPASALGSRVLQLTALGEPTASSSEEAEMRATHMWCVCTLGKGFVHLWGTTATQWQGATYVHDTTLGISVWGGVRGGRKRERPAPGHLAAGQPWCRILSKILYCCFSGSPVGGRLILPISYGCWQHRSSLKWWNVLYCKGESISNIFEDEGAQLDHFKTWPQEAPVDATTLAKAGFFYTGSVKG